MKVSYTVQGGMWRINMRESRFVGSLVSFTAEIKIRERIDPTCCWKVKNSWPCKGWDAKASGKHVTVTRHWCKVRITFLYMLKGRKIMKVIQNLYNCGISMFSSFASLNIKRNFSPFCKNNSSTQIPSFPKIISTLANLTSHLQHDGFSSKFSLLCVTFLFILITTLATICV